MNITDLSWHDICFALVFAGFALRLGGHFYEDLLEIISWGVEKLFLLLRKFYRKLRRKGEP